MEFSTKLCRCCLKANAEMKSILTDNMEINWLACNIQSLPISECFKNVLPEITDNGDSKAVLVSLICKDCENRLKLAYEFRQECLNSDTVLKETPPDAIVPKVEIKEEYDIFPEIFVTEIIPVKKEKRKRSPPPSPPPPIQSTSKATRRRKRSPQPSKSTRKAPRRRSSTAVAKKTEISDDEELEEEDRRESTSANNTSNVKCPEATFICYYCDAVLSTHNEFIDHREMHRAPGEWAITRVCNMCCTDVKDYLKHIQDQHAEYKPNVCKTCNKTFVIQNELKNHLLTHSNAKNYTCQSCPMAFKSIKALQSHILSKPVTSYHCVFCGASFPTILATVTHVQESHQESRNKLLLPCFKCKKIFLSFITLDSHKCDDLKNEMVGDRNTWSCNDCNENFMQEEHLNCHRMVCANRRNGNLLFCYICIKEFSTQHQLTGHIYSVHNSKRIFQCEKCGHQSPNASSLSSHIKSIHTNLRAFKCNHPGCTRGFKDMHQLRHHMRSHFPATYECYLCNKTYKTYFNLKKHMSEHCESLKQYKCDTCPMKFYDKHMLRDHRAAGHNPGQKVYRCKKCPASYSRHCSLIGHVQKVHKKIRYHCKHCDKHYADKKSLFVHVFNHRGDKPWNCFQCQQGFIRKSMFKNHLMMKHGIMYDEDLHGFKEAYGDVIAANLRKVTEGDYDEMA